jgi:hypothetical protein
LPAISEDFQRFLELMDGRLSLLEFIHGKNGIAFGSSKIVPGIGIDCKNLIGDTHLKTS